VADPDEIVSITLDKMWNDLFIAGVPLSPVTEDRRGHTWTRGPCHRVAIQMDKSKREEGERHDRADQQKTTGASRAGTHKE